MADFIQVAKVSDIPSGGAKRFPCGETYVAIFHTDDGFVAIDDACTHRGEPLSAGEVVDGILTCRYHGARFELDTGKCLGRPGRGDVGRHEVRISGDDVEVRLGEVRSRPPDDDDWFDYA